MSQSFIYIVGQPDTQSGIVEAIHELGYKAGLLLDQKLTIKNPENYDRVELVNFEAIEDEFARLDTLNLDAVGLQCTFENYIVAKAKLAKHFELPSLSVEAALLATDKSLMRQAFLDADRSISPDFQKVNTLDEALSFAAQHSYPLMLKPTSLVKSLLVLRCNNEQELTENFAYAKETVVQLHEKYHVYGREPQLIIEEFISGEQYSIAAFTDAEGMPHFCEGIVSLVTAQNIGVDDNYLYSRTLPTTLDPKVEREMFRVAEIGIKALKLRSVPAHVELISGEHGTKIVEIGARIGGYRSRMYNYSYDLNLLKEEIALAVGKQPDLHGTFQDYCAVYELFPTHEGTFARIVSDVDTNNFTYYREVAKYGTLVGPAKNGFKASAIIIVTNKDINTFQKLCRNVDQLSVEVVA